MSFWADDFSLRMRPHFNVCPELNISTMHAVISTTPQSIHFTPCLCLTVKYRDSGIGSRCAFEIKYMKVYTMTSETAGQRN